MFRCFRCIWCPKNDLSELALRTRRKTRGREEMLEDPSIRLRAAIVDGNLLITKRILTRFPDLLDIVDPSNGWSLLHYASFYGRYLVCVYLLQLGHDQKEILRTFKDNTCVHLALLNGHEQTTHLLLQHFPGYLNCKGHSGMTPVQITCLNDHYQCLSLLLSLGADLSITDDEGNTPLHICLTYGSVNCMKMLVLEGNMLDDTIRNKGNWKPIDVAQTFDIAKAYQKVLKEAQSHAVKKKPSYHSMISPVTISKPTFENSGSPVLSTSSAMQSFTSHLPPLPTISTSRRASIGSQNLWSPKTPISHTFNLNSHPLTTPPHGKSPNKLASRPSILNQSLSTSSASLIHKDSSTSMNSDRNKLYDSSNGIKRSQTSGSSEIFGRPNPSTTSFNSCDGQFINKLPSASSTSECVLRENDKTNNPDTSTGISSPATSERAKRISLLNIPISKLRNRD